MVVKNEMEAIKALSEKVEGIVESGSNDNGSWVKFADGTMIQWGQTQKDNVTFSPTENIYYTPENQTILYPTAFKVSPCLFVSVRTSSTAWTMNVASTTTTGIFRVGQNAGEARTVYIQWHAIGKWK